MALVVVAVIALVPSGVLAEPAEQSPDPTCGKHPCEGWAYELRYRLTDGTVIGLGGYPEDQPRPDESRPGESSLIVTEDPRLRDIMFHFQDYVVDLVTGEVVSKSGESGPSDGGFDPPLWLLVATGIAGVGALGVAAFLGFRFAGKRR